MIPERFWEAYATNRYNLLVRGVRERGEEADGKRRAGYEGTDSVPPRYPTNYLVYLPGSYGLGNNMFGIMSAFALSIATERVFLHDWTEGMTQ